MAIDLSCFVFSLTKKWPPQYKFSLTDQFNRAALSIALNIAEGSSRTPNDFKHFLAISRGSCFECVAIVSIAKKLSVISPEQEVYLLDILNHIAKMISALRKSIIKSSE